ncbi:UNVERIFIED_CONTAM: hypothetical protein GTU68_054083 [Idotea baltica]|nr:hypothetical protein [Idotea baltica]
MDGWGHGRADESNAIHLAKTPFVDSLYNSVPHAELRTDGVNVGLPEGQMGNSEVGHLNIGAGRIVYQDLQRINASIDKGELKDNSTLVEALSLAKKEGRKLHLVGLLSDGGVHSSQAHVHALLDICAAQDLKDVYVHAFMDGRDTGPENGKAYVAALQEQFRKSTGKLATMIGRYYAMDRDKRWDRIKKTYDLLVSGVGVASSDPIAALQSSYDAGVTDEFIDALVVDPAGIIDADDVVICFNYRTDRCREITEVLTQVDMPAYDMKTIPLQYFTMTRYDEKYKDVGVFFSKDNLAMTLGEVVSKAGKTQVRIAETEKYPHVTFFFSGGREKEFAGEGRIIVSSPNVATYDLQPEMNALKVKDAICDRMATEAPDLVILNFANPDMVGHTGVQTAIIKAVETTDAMVADVVKAGKAQGYEFIIIADHGNAELNIWPYRDGSPHTSHPQSCASVYIGDTFRAYHSAVFLADVASQVYWLLCAPSHQR